MFIARCPISKVFHPFYTQTGEPYVVISDNGHWEFCPLHSKRTRQLLERCHHKLYGTRLSESKMRDLWLDLRLRADSSPQSGIYVPGVSQSSGAELAGSRTALNNNVGSELNPQPASARRIKVRLTVPLNDNNDNPIEPSLLKFFEKEVVAIAGGLTILGDTIGFFAMPDGHICTDRNRLYEVAVTSRDHIPLLIKLLQEIGSLMEQDSVYYEIDPMTECYIQTVELQQVKSLPPAPMQADPPRPLKHIWENLGCVKKSFTEVG